MSLAGRLRQARDAKGWYQAEAGRRAGINENTVSRYERGDRLPGISHLTRLAEVYGVSMDWLLMGEGGLSEDVRNVESVPVLSAVGPVAAAGPGGFAGVEWEDEEVPFPRAWLREHRVSSRNCCLFRVSGESMEPGIIDGSMVLVDRGSVELFPGRVYVILVAGDLVVKRVERQGVVWQVVSDNPLWERFPLEAGMEVVGEVRWVGRWL